IVTNMGNWEQKEYYTDADLLLPQPYLNLSYDLHDFYSIDINASENISIMLNLPQNNTYGIELFNGSNANRLVTSAWFSGNDTNKTLYFDVNYTGQYFFRVNSVYDDPYMFGGSGDYEFYILIQPQNTAPEVRMGAINNIFMFEDEPPRTLLLNDSIFFDADVGIAMDSLSFYILNGTTWQSSYLSENLSVTIASDGNTTINVLPDINTTGEQLIFKAVDWLGTNITHTMTVIVTPVNDGPFIKTVNSKPVTSHYLDLINNQTGYFGAWEDQTFTMSVNASDKEGNELEFVHKSTKSFFYSVGYNDPNNRNYTFTPDNTMVGIVQINVSINESNDYSVPGDWVVVNITVNNTNDEPLVIKVNDAFYSAGSKLEFLGKKGVFVGETITFKITAIDVDVPHGDSLTFNITEPKPRGIIDITKLPAGALITESEANISFT
ncbi:MAG: hypothetical protein KAJ51_03650, partial [Thermoplasmata archaeon]|nr:hypothetical protein [Thermoplasmata archaeon]